MYHPTTCSRGSHLPSIHTGGCNRRVEGVTAPVEVRHNTRQSARSGRLGHETWH